MITQSVNICMDPLKSDHVTDSYLCDNYEASSKDKACIHAPSRVAPSLKGCVVILSKGYVCSLLTLTTGGKG